MMHVSYNDRIYPDIDTMKAIIEPYRNVKVERKTYSAGRGKKCYQLYRDYLDNFSINYERYD